MACHPNFPILLIIKLLEPIESPRTKSNRNMVREILFSTFAKSQITQQISNADTRKHYRYNSKHKIATFRMKHRF